MFISVMFKGILVILLSISLVSATEFSINSEPSNARVWIDGNYTHHLTPTDEVEQADVIELWGVGKHTLKLTKTGYLLEQEIELVESSRLILNLSIPSIENSEKESHEDVGTSENNASECPKCKKCKDCPKCEDKVIEKVIYKENRSCNPKVIEKIINSSKGCIVYKSDETKDMKYGLYFLCFVLILLVISYEIRIRNKSNSRDCW